MLPKKQRVPKGLFPSSQSKKINISSHIFSISFIKNTEKARVSCVVSKKVAGSAVARNIIRRRVYAIFEELLKPQTTGIIVVYAKKPATSAQFKALKVDLVELMQKIGI